MQRFLTQFAFSCGLFLIGLQSSHAVTRSWDDGGFGDNWNLVNNWSPNGNPGGDDLFIGDLPQGVGEQTIVNFDFTIESLTMTNGSSADTDGNQLIVNGLTSIAGANTALRIRDDADGGAAALLTETLFIGSGAIAEMYDNSEVIVGNGALTNFGTIQGNGGLRLLDNPVTPTSLFTNTGTLSVGVPGFLQGAEARTLAITAIDSDARVDLDGNGNGVVSLQSKATLDLDVPLLDAFSGDINLGPNSTLDVQNSWQVDGNINVNSSFPALVDEATIAGGLLSLNNGAVLTLDEADEVLRLNAALTAGNGSTFANSGTVIFDAPAQFGASADFQMNGNFASLVVNSEVTINNPIDIDGAGTPNNQVTINETGRLIIQSTSEKRVDNVININGGHLVYNGSLQAQFDGVINMHSEVDQRSQFNWFTPILSAPIFTIGDGIGTSDAIVNISGPGVSEVNISDAQLFWLSSDAVVNIAAGATLEVNGRFSAQTGAQVLGEGTLRMGRIHTSSDTTLDVAVLDLDYGVSPGDEGHIIRRSFTINADSIEEDGGGFDGDILVIRDPDDPSVLSGHLTMNVPGGWLFNSGTITLEIASGPSATMLSGDRVTIGAAANLIADGLRIDVDAPFTLEGTINVPNANEIFGSIGPLGGPRLENRIAGGTISGSGNLALSQANLTGFGTINTAINASSESQIFADDGTLNINGTLFSIGSLGVTDDGVLNVSNPWGTNHVVNGSVFLEGGEITGATITHNNGLIRGNGSITAAVINNREIIAEGGGTLILDPLVGDSDYDGASDNGVLRASTANLTLRNENLFSTQDFRGRMRVLSGQEIFVDGFSLILDSASDVDLTNGSLRFNGFASIRGSLDVLGSLPSRIVREGPGGLTFIGSTTQLNADLELDANITSIAVSAQFSGLGSLVNLQNSELALQVDAEVAVSVVNHGIFGLGTLGDSVPASASVGGFSQTSTGEFDVNISGIAPGTFDVLTVSNNAILDGTLDVDLYNGFLPILGNSFTILETTFGNVGGIFAVEDFPVFNGLTFDVIYNSQSVVLQVVEAMFEADFDNDGDVDGDDLTQWEGDFGGPGSDADGDGDSDGADFLVWQQQFGSGVPSTATSQTIPEPTTLTLFAGLSFALLARRGQQALFT